MTILFGSDPQVEATDQRTIFDLCLDTHLQPQNRVTLHSYILNIYIYIYVYIYIYMYEQT